MTTDNKTMPVNVLQWLGDERFMYGPDTESRIKCEEARAAVAELIEASSQVHDAVAGNEDWGRLWSALARVKGESA